MTSDYDADAAMEAVKSGAVSEAMTLILMALKNLGSEDWSLQVHEAALAIDTDHHEDESFVCDGAEQLVMDWRKVDGYSSCGYIVKTGAGASKTVRVYGSWDENQPATDPGGADSVQLQDSSKVIAASSIGAEYFRSRPTYIGATIEGTNTETAEWHFSAMR